MTMLYPILCNNVVVFDKGTALLLFSLYPTTLCTVYSVVNSSIHIVCLL